MTKLAKHLKVGDCVRGSRIIMKRFNILRTIVYISLENGDYFTALPNKDIKLEVG